MAKRNESYPRILLEGRTMVIAQNILKDNIKPIKGSSTLE